MSEKRSEKCEMHSGTLEMRNFIERNIPPTEGELKKSWLYRAGYKTGLGYSRVKDLYYSQKSSIRHKDIVAIQRAASALRQSTETAYAELKIKHEAIDEELAEELKSYLAQAHKLARRLGLNWDQ